MQIKCWGVRGSIPTPSNQTFESAEYGGNTTCYQIVSGNLLVVVDTGSGALKLGRELAALNRPMQIHLFYSHVHWDHIIGFPFFEPARRENCEIIIHTPRLAVSRVPHDSPFLFEQIFRKQQRPPFCPIPLSSLGARIQFVEFSPNSEMVLEDDQVRLAVQNVPVNHPGGCYGFRFIESKKASEDSERIGVICTDHEHGKDLHPAVQKLCEGASVLLYDAAFTTNEYEGIGTFSRKFWGHSTWERGLMEARAAGVDKLYLMHHEPIHDDEFIRSQIEQPCAEAAKDAGLFAACCREEQVIEV